MVKKSPTFIDNQLLLFPDKSAHVSDGRLRNNFLVRASNFDTLFIREEKGIHITENMYQIIEQSHLSTSIFVETLKLGPDFDVQGKRRILYLANLSLKLYRLEVEFKMLAQWATLFFAEIKP